MRIAILFLLLFLNQANVQAAMPIQPGELITYTIQQMGMKAGEATLEFVGPKDYDGKSTVLIVFTSKGFNFFDQEKIYLDPSTYRPVIVERDLNIFGKKEKITERYEGGLVKVIKKKADSTDEVITIKKAEVDNIYGFIYRYRQQGSFELGNELNITLPTKDFKIALKKKVVIDAAKKKYNSYFMESNPGKYKIWFDEGNLKLPLRISGAVGIGNTVMIMSKYQEK